MKGEIGERQRLLHMLEAIVEIEGYTLNTNFTSFL
jgi:hypothetical protein